MQHSKAIEMLKALRIWELKSFEKFVLSPYHNPNSQVTRLFNQLKKHYPQFNSDEISYSRLSSLIFKNKKNDVPRFRHVLTELTRLLEQYYVQISLEERKTEWEKFLSAQFYKRNLDKYLVQRLSLNKVNTEHRKDVAYYENMIAWSEISYEFASSRQNRKPETELQNLSDNLDNYYLTKKLKYSCEILNRSNILGTAHSIPLLETLSTYLKKNHTTTPLISIYYQILQTITDNKNETHFKKLKLLLDKHRNEITLKENRDIYAFAQNYCIRQLNTGNIYYLTELFDIYKTVLTEKIIFDNYQLSHADFKNICAVGIRLNELKWVEDFIKSHDQYLSKELRTNSVNYNQARLHFARRQYKPAIKLLTKVEFTDVFYHLDAKSLLLKIYFESHAYEALYSLTNAFNIYLKRSQQISAYQRTIYTNYLKRIKLLAQLRAGDKTLTEKIKTELQKEVPLADATWIKEKTNSFIL